MSPNGDAEKSTNSFLDGDVINISSKIEAVGVGGARAVITVTMRCDRLPDNVCPDALQSILQGIVEKSAPEKIEQARRKLAAKSATWYSTNHFELTTVP